MSLPSNQDIKAYLNYSQILQIMQPPNGAACYICKFAFIYLRSKFNHHMTHLHQTALIAQLKGGTSITDCIVKGKYLYKKIVLMGIACPRGQGGVTLAIIVRCNLFFHVLVLLSGAFLRLVLNVALCSCNFGFLVLRGDGTRKRKMI